VSEREADQDALAARILEAAQSNAKCVPVGTNSKGQFETSDDCWRLSTLAFNEVLSYEPTELVLTAGAGARLGDLNARLASQGQMLGFEAFNGEHATLGGAVACGIAGPARPYRGAIRDFVLGCQVLNGRGERLNFGGQVIKNVAGYDVSRLFAGSWGTLGVMLQVSVRVLPRPEREIGVALECGVDDALKRMGELGRSACPLSGAAFVDGVLHLRLAGFASAMEAAAKRIGGSEIGVENGPWQSLTDARHDFFVSETPIYRLSLPSALPHLDIPGRWLIDWGGALRWLATEVPVSEWLPSVIKTGGRMLVWPPTRANWLRSGDAVIDGLQARIRKAFDPNGVFL